MHPRWLLVSGPTVSLAGRLASSLSQAQIRDYHDDNSGADEDDSEDFWRNETKTI